MNNSGNNLLQIESSNDNFTDRLFQSQYGQDKLVCEMTNYHTKGIFVDVGAYDGVTINNTFYLEKVLDWNGIIIEPIPLQAERCLHNRWCTVWNGCCSDQCGEEEFLHVWEYSEMLSCMKNKSDSKHMDRINKEVEGHRQTINSIKVPCITLNKLLEDNKITCVDYLSLDGQSAEFYILKGLDVSKCSVKIISVDFNGYDDGRIVDWMRDNGYELYRKFEYTDERVYINNKMKYSWE